MDLLVAADDRTGAFEAAATIADRGCGPVPVVPWPAPDRFESVPVAVVDLACRHLLPTEAAERAASLPDATHQAHKTDSTLRGNWADELVARSARRPVLLVPALPAFGRTCIGGVVYDHGRPIHVGAADTDVRRRVRTARPAESLRAAGGLDVYELPDVDAVAKWLEAPAGVAVADAESDATIEAIAGLWIAVADRVVLAGTSTVVGGAARAVRADGPAETLPDIDGPVLVACGSVHPASREQLEMADHRGVPVTYLADAFSVDLLRRDGVLVLASEIPVGDVTEPMAVAAAASLARGVDVLRDEVELGALVILGGDTAAAVIGDASVVVHGSVDIGTAWARVEGFDMPVITRSGGFGHDTALIDLLAHLGAR